MEASYREKRENITTQIRKLNCYQHARDDDMKQITFERCIETNKCMTKLKINEEGRTGRGLPCSMLLK